MRHRNFALTLGTLGMLIVTLVSISVVAIAMKGGGGNREAMSRDGASDLQPSVRWPHGARRIEPSSSQTLQLTIDGRKTPQAIPDDYAWHHLLAATALSRLHSPGQINSIRSRIKAIGLSDFDRAAYEAALTAVRFRDELTRLSAERAALTPRARMGSTEAARKLQQLQNDQRQAMRVAKTRVFESLSSGGIAVLHVQNVVKTQIRVLSAPMGSREAHEADDERQDDDD